MTKTVLSALDDQTVFQQMVEWLNQEESEVELEISQNIDSQATFLYFLPKIRPQAVVISERLPGELSLTELIHRIEELSPETEIIVFRGDFAEVGERLLGQNEYLRKIVAVWSPSGGVGKTEIAKNLALAAGDSFRVILLDANLCNPDIAEHLGLGYQKGHTLSTALELWSENRLAPRTLRKVLLPYGNIRVLVGSEDTIEQTDYTPVFFRDLLRTLSQFADFVIADMDSDITSPAGLSVLLASHHIITPFNTVSSTLCHSKVYYDLLTESYQMNPLKFDPILNKAGEGGKISEEDIELCVKRPVIATIPYNKAYLRSSCEGTPHLISNRPSARKLFRIFQGVIRNYARKDMGVI